MDIPREDIESLIRDKYEGDRFVDLTSDIERLRRGEPLAYVIGWIPFLDLHIDLTSKPLIPRTETEWWTEQLIQHLQETNGDTPFSLLDLCAGSGAIGLAVLSTFPHATVTFSELVPAHGEQIIQNAAINGIDASRVDVRVGNVFEPIGTDTFDIIATNPPYIPSDRTLEDTLSFEPSEALYSGSSGMDVITRICTEAQDHINLNGELWMECDVSNIEMAQALIPGSTIRTDQYGRPRVLVGYF
ncbi:HemK family protein methyltransferase [Patescibacteria group bacterium]|nr:HemK family protein methyltransferase [Patescibacteria group bacterium]